MSWQMSWYIIKLTYKGSKVSKSVPYMGHWLDIYR